MLQQVIINILVKTYNFSYAEAYKKWYKAQVTGNDQVVYDIIDGLIKDNPNGGIPFLINRNPKQLMLFSVAFVGPILERVW